MDRGESGYCNRFGMLEGYFFVRCFHAVTMLWLLLLLLLFLLSLPQLLLPVLLRFGAAWTNCIGSEHCTRSALLITGHLPPFRCSLISCFPWNSRRHVFRGIRPLCSGPSLAAVLLLVPSVLWVQAVQRPPDAGGGFRAGSLVSRSSLFSLFFLFLFLFYCSLSEQGATASRIA